MTEPKPIPCICGHVIDRHEPHPEGDAELVCGACDCDSYVEDDTEALF